MRRSRRMRWSPRPSIRIFPIIQNLRNKNHIRQRISNQPHPTRGIQYNASINIVGRTCWNTAPRTLNTSPASQITRNDNESPSPDRRRKFSIICGENTTSQQTMEILPVIPEMVSVDRDGSAIGGTIFVFTPFVAVAVAVAVPVPLFSRFASAPIIFGQD
jgi:hypothetical protein